MKILEIESQQNSTFQGFLALQEGGEVAKLGQALLFGRKTVAETLLTQAGDVVAVIIAHDDQLIDLAVAKHQQIYRLKKSLFEKLNQFGTRGPLLVVKVPQIKVLEASTQLKGRFLYVPFQDPGNVGGVLRSAAAFGMTQIILGPGASHPFHARSSRAASGTLFLHRYFRVKDLETLSALKVEKIGLDMHGENVHDAVFGEDFILIPGVEGAGLKSMPETLFSRKINIPISPRVESLNAMVATSIVLAAMNARRK